MLQYRELDERVASAFYSKAIAKEESVSVLRIPNNGGFAQRPPRVTFGHALRGQARRA